MFASLEARGGDWEALEGVEWLLGVSDLHVDYPANAHWVAALPECKADTAVSVSTVSRSRRIAPSMDSCCCAVVLCDGWVQLIVAGDVTHSMQQLRSTLETLVLCAVCCVPCAVCCALRCMLYAVCSMLCADAPVLCTRIQHVSAQAFSHRIKSIGMSTFTPQDVALASAQGNQSVRVS